MPVGSPFPHHLWNSPFLNHTDKTLTTVSLWQSSKNSGNLVKSLVDRCRKINLSKLHRFQEAGLDQDSLQEAIEGLNALSDCYRVNFDTM